MSSFMATGLLLFLSLAIPAFSQLTIARYSSAPIKGVTQIKGMTLKLKGTVKSAALVSFTDVSGRQFNDWAVLTKSSGGFLTGSLIACGYGTIPCPTSDIAAVTAIRVYEDLGPKKHRVAVRDWACNAEWKCEERVHVGLPSDR